jgi:hypothetical protein
MFNAQYSMFNAQVVSEVLPRVDCISLNIEY